MRNYDGLKREVRLADVVMGIDTETEMQDVYFGLEFLERATVNRPDSWSMATFMIDPKTEQATWLIRACLEEKGACDLGRVKSADPPDLPRLVTAGWTQGGITARQAWENHETGEIVIRAGEHQA